MPFPIPIKSRISMAKETNTHSVEKSNKEDIGKPPLTAIKTRILLLFVSELKSYEYTLLR